MTERHRGLWPRWSAALVFIVALVSSSAAQDRPTYDRSLYRHWIRVEGTCRDVRAVVLIRDAEPGSVFFADPRECRVGGGVWRDPYTGQTFSDPREIEHRSHGATEECPRVGRLGVGP